MELLEACEEGREGIQPAAMADGVARASRAPVRHRRDVSCGGDDCLLGNSVQEAVVPGNVQCVVECKDITIAVKHPFPVLSASKYPSGSRVEQRCS